MKMSNKTEQINLQVLFKQNYKPLINWQVSCRNTIKSYND